ncbi:T9SS type A sorting domain-containing protein [Yeosuana sp.]|uniref:T9SS type A sorting domain-containing protein n=1 Tax=Yeosuana sp. TaxID=2529388 RepID=UPI004054D215|tara:strand:+ start:20098 stop:21234 length:1137 start_codon:yes stop_codon:yes gene_type:complete
MKIITSFSIFVLGICHATGQISTAVEKFALPTNISESSGAIFFNNKLITHNDSGGENKLYELDTISGLVTREVTISNATNVDWEDITQDGGSIYIGDIGNNVSGNRTDLKIYKISKSDYLSSETVNAQTIAFNYSDQIDFAPTSVNNTEWDAETLVSFDAINLILFTKNWVNGTTKGYLIPKAAGTYSVSPLATTLNSGGLISGGTYNPLTAKLFLVGYTNTDSLLPLQPFVWVSDGFIGSDVFSGTNTKTSLTSFGFEQTEAITYVNESRYFMTSESFSNIISDYAKAIAFSTNDVALSIDDHEVADAIILYPNPVKDFLKIDAVGVNAVEIYDMKLTKLYNGNNTNIDMTSFSPGIYVIKISFKDHFQVMKKIVKK